MSILDRYIRSSFKREGEFKSYVGNYKPLPMTRLFVIEKGRSVTHWLIPPLEALCNVRTPKILTIMELTI